MLLLLMVLLMLMVLLRWWQRGLLLQLFYPLLYVVRRIGIERVGLDLGVYVLTQVAEGNLILLRWVQKLLRASSGGIEGIIVLLVGLRRRGVVGHLCVRPQLIL